MNAKSEKNKYWIEKHRYYELKHFCLQYPIWKKAHTALNDLSQKLDSMDIQVSKWEEAKSFYFERMKMIEQAAEETNSELSGYFLEAVTDGIAYDHLETGLVPSCVKEVYYDLYRQFFWRLFRKRQ